MQAIAKVWNDHNKEHVEKFKGDEIRIPANGYIEMPWQEAIQFRGQYSPIIRDGLGNDLKPKKIRLEKKSVESSDANIAPIFMCQMDRQEFGTQAELDEHVRINHLESLVDENAKRLLQKKK